MTAIVASGLTMNKKYLNMFVLLLFLIFTIIFLVFFTSPHNILIAILLNILLSCFSFVLVKMAFSYKFALLTSLFVLTISNLKLFSLLGMLNFVLAVFLFLGIVILIK